MTNSLKKFFLTILVCLPGFFLLASFFVTPANSKVRDFPDACVNDSEPITSDCVWENVVNNECYGVYFRYRRPCEVTPYPGQPPIKGVEAEQRECRCFYKETYYYCPKATTVADQHQVTYWTYKATLTSLGYRCWWPESTVVDTTSYYCTDSQQNCEQCCTYYPPVTPTPTTGPTCALGQSSTTGQNLSGLSNQWKYQPFSVSSTVDVEAVQVLAGNYGGTWRKITCKITNGDGTVDKSAALESVDAFRSDADSDYMEDIAWRGVYFRPNMPRLDPGSYKIACKGPDAYSSLYWVFDWAKGEDSGKTYKIFFCPVPSSTPTQTPTPSPVFSPTPAPEAWFQTKEGDVHAGRNIVSKLPASYYFSAVGAGGFPGLVSYYGSNAQFYNGQVSQKEWLGKTPLYIMTRKPYDYFYAQTGSPQYLTPPAGDLPTPPAGTYAYSGNISVPPSGWDIGTKKVVIFTNGKFLLRGKTKINVAGGGSLIVFAKGDVGVSKDVSSTEVDPVQGIFFTNGTFFSSIEDNFLFVQVASSDPLVIEGGVMAQSGVIMSRDLGDANLSKPAEMFKYNPAFVLNCDKSLWRGVGSWTELAP